jgi:ribosomal protein S18 acetylase RimI-like enzyme
MAPEPSLFYFCRPTHSAPVSHPVDFLSVQEFLTDEPACQTLWELLSTQFRTRGKFLTIWQGVRFVAVHRDPNGGADGFLLITTPINWQIDYVVVRPDRRGNGVATALLAEAVNQAYQRHAPYIMLTSRESLRAFYEGCGFTVVGRDPIHPTPSHPGNESRAPSPTPLQTNGA